MRAGSSAYSTYSVAEKLHAFGIQFRTDEANDQHFECRGRRQRSRHGNPLELAAVRRLLFSVPMQSLARYLQKLPRQTRAVCETCVYGLAAGAATVAFQLRMIGRDDRCYICRLD